MDEQTVERVLSIADHLPEADVLDLAAAVRGGPRALQQLRSAAGSPAVREAVDVMTISGSGVDQRELSGLLVGASTMRRRCEERQRLDVVWTGPPVHGGSHRLTAAVLVELIDSAVEEVLLIGFAVHGEPSISAALSAAGERGVEVTLLLERPEDNARYSTRGTPPFSGLRGRRLAWPATERPSEHASLHAKVLAIDRRTALVTSANVTHSALHANIECGVIVHDARAARSIVEHVEALVDQGSLVDV